MKGTPMEGTNGEDRAITEFLSPADERDKTLTHSHTKMMINGYFPSDEKKKKN